MSDFENRQHVDHPDYEPILDEEGRCLRCAVSYLEGRVAKLVDDRIRATVEQIDPAKGNVIVLKGWDWLGAEIPKLFEAVKYAWGEPERDRLTVVELAGDASIETLDDDEMRGVGWIRLAAVRSYLDEAITNWRERREATESPTATSMAACYVDAFQSVRDSLVGETLP